MTGQSIKSVFAKALRSVIHTLKEDKIPPAWTRKEPADGSSLITT